MSLQDLFLRLKGSSKSGNFGHGGVPGHRGGSAPKESKSGLTSKPSLKPTKNNIENFTEYSKRLSFAEEDLIKKATEDWAGAKKTEILVRGLRAASRDEGNTLITLSQNKKNIDGIAVIQTKPIKIDGVDGKFINIRDIASNKKGVGSNLIKEIVKKAKSKKAGITLTSSEESLGFYQKLGFTKLNNNPKDRDYYISYEKLGDLKLG